MGLLETILIIVILVVLVIVIWNIFFKKQTMLMDGIQESAPGIMIDYSKLPENNSSNYSMAIWFYIEDWNTSYGTVKNIINLAKTKKDIGVSLGTSSGSGSSANTGLGLNPNNNSFVAALDAYENDLLIGVKTFGGGAASGTTVATSPNTSYFSEQNLTGSSNSNFSYETFKVSNVNVQKWVCLIVCICGRNLDIYLHGKLVRSFILPGVAVGIGNDNAYIGGSKSKTFGGHVARFQFFDKCLNPQEAYNIYREGLGSNLFGDFFNKYRMKIQFYEYNHALGKPIVL